MIARDGANISLWQNTAEPFIPTRNLSADQTYDVVIAGGGITGVSTALLLQQAGLRCVLIEAHTLCFGTTGGTTAHLNTLLDTPYTTIAKNFDEEKAALVARAARESINTVQANIARYQIDCNFEEATGFLFSQNEKQTQELEEIRKATMEAGVFVSYTDGIPLPIQFEKALEIKNQAKFHPVRYVMALAKAYEEAGGTIVQNCRVMDTDNTDPLVVKTEAGDVRASWLIYTTHIPPGVNLLHLRCAPYRSYAMAVRLTDDKYPAGLTYDMYDPYHYYRTQVIDGEQYLIIGGEDHKTAHADNTMMPFTKLESHIRSNFNNVKEIAYRWSSQYFEPADGLPYIGHLPGQPGKILVATGFGGNGITYSTVAARTLTDIVLNKENPNIQLFNPNRLKPIAGFTNFVKENVDVAKQLITGFFTKEKIHALADIAPGEGKVVHVEGHIIALYKDEAGELHSLNPRCTHLKCTVSWSLAEKCWECPCHGARYDFNGKVLTGPADMDLQKIKL
ncbi:FAD-dependent oxidoreductase [Niastella caeni]|uniref:FAD-dependent oxidoreductase n=1 Tax=Niastella caeni TaxID=2569763 RepID=A0A4S8HEF9_9BACT|nr:FAD-dependent oxidoreductase [Niastella caeni]THU32519.1 FAD-dependent oxidoreductase [Niastella caeni]